MHHHDILNVLQNLTNEKPTQQKLADILGEKIGTIGARAMRNSNYSFEEIKKIGDFYNVDLLQGCIKNELINSYNSKHSEKTENQVTLEPLTASYDYDEQAKYSIVKVVGNSMETTLSDGSICIVKNYNGEQIKDNAIYFFSYGDESYIKRLAKNINEIVIMSDNKRYSDIVLKGDELDKIKIYGEVVKNMRDF